MQESPESSNVDAAQQSTLSLRRMHSFSEMGEKERGGRGGSGVVGMRGGGWVGAGECRGRKAGERGRRGGRVSCRALQMHLSR